MSAITNAYAPLPDDDPEPFVHECPVCGGSGWADWCKWTTRNELVFDSGEPCPLKHEHKTVTCACDDGWIDVPDLDAETIEAEGERVRKRLAGRMLHELEQRTAMAWGASVNLDPGEATVEAFRDDVGPDGRVSWLEAVAGYEAAMERGDMRE